MSEPPDPATCPRLDMPPEKTTIGPQDFKKIKLLGQGDVGKVYLVSFKETDQLYAMKVLSKQEMIRRNKVKRALTEREILATSKHPFIVTLHYSFQSQDNLYFVMDYCAGGEFFRTLQNQPGKHLSEDAARFYAGEVLLALEYLHSIGFIYRDLKPENILLHATGHIMLTDFDLSKAATSVKPQLVKKMFSKPTLVNKPELVTNSFVGTEEYLAPEVIEGYGHTSSVDWWTFGILVYEMVFGVTPYRGTNRDQTFEHILTGGLKFPDHPQTTKECRSLLKALLTPDPKKRLGAEHGASDVKQHKWFKSLNLTLIRNSSPPIQPRINFAADTRNFRNIEDPSIGVSDKGIDPAAPVKPDDPFKEFLPVSKNDNSPRGRLQTTSSGSAIGTTGSNSVIEKEKEREKDPKEKDREKDNASARGSKSVRSAFKKKDKKKDKKDKHSASSSESEKDKKKEKKKRGQGRRE